MNSFTAALLVALIVACISRTAGLGFRRPGARRARRRAARAARTEAGR